MLHKDDMEILRKLFRQHNYIMTTAELTASKLYMQKRWKYFLKNIKDNTFEFAIVIDEIRTFLEPVFDAIVNEDEWQKKWIVNSGWRSL